MISLTAVRLLLSSRVRVLGESDDPLASASASVSGSDWLPGYAAAESSDAPLPDPVVVLVGTRKTANRLAKLLVHGDAAATLSPEQVRVESVIGLSLPRDVRPLDEAVQRIAAGKVDWLVLLSRPACTFVMNRCSALGVADAARRLKVACVGAGTADAAAAAGFSPSWVAKARTAVGLVDEAMGSGVFCGERVLVPRSAIGDDEVLQPLRSQVAELRLVSAYENRPRPIDERAWERYASAGRGAVITFLSSSAVTALWSGLPLDAQERLVSHARCLAIGPSTADTMRQVRWPPVAVADPPGLERLAELIREQLDSTR